MIQLLRPLMICGIILLNGCTRVVIPSEPSPNYYGPDPINTCQVGRTCSDPVSTRTTIELRVLGNAQSVRVRYSNSQDGLTQVITTLPYIIQFDTTNDTMFLNLEATPISYSILTVFPFLSVQIFANSSLFREANSTDFYLNTLSVSGTWRK